MNEDVAQLSEALNKPSGQTTQGSQVQQEPLDNRPSKWQRQSADGKDENNQTELEELRNILNMVTTRLLRHEVQQNINRMDTGFVIFLQTTQAQNLAFLIGKAWKEMEQNEPEKLKAPMRSVLLQHLLKVALERFQAMMSTPSSRSEAQELGWISENADQVYGLRWNMEVEEGLREMIELCMRPLVVHRYHATRTLAAQYQSPVVTMMLEVGNRSEESQLAWKRLHRLAQSAAWTSAGCYLRHERLQLSTSRTTTGQSLGEEIDADHQAVMCLKLGNDGNFCYMNTVVQCIVHLCCLLGDSRLFFKDEAPRLAEDALGLAATAPAARCC
ncbi:unnamed protein product [Symbiodinium sp. KB8]|nr:unnamed protein product [Symbiodinium sp. KB8]